MSAETRESTSKRLFIGGDWADAEDGRTFEDRDPFTGELVAEVAAGTRADARRAVEAAAAAAPAWAQTPPAVRQGIFLKAADVLESRRDEVVSLLARETGSTFGFGMFQMHFVPGLFRQTAALAYAPVGEVIPSDMGAFAMGLRRPGRRRRGDRPLERGADPVRPLDRGAARAWQCRRAQAVRVVANRRRPDLGRDLRRGRAARRRTEHRAQRAWRGGPHRGRARREPARAPAQLHRLDRNRPQAGRGGGPAAQAGRAGARRLQPADRPGRRRPRVRGQRNGLRRIPAPGPDLHVRAQDHRRAPDRGRVRLASRREDERPQGRRSERARHDHRAAHQRGRARDGQGPGRCGREGRREGARGRAAPSGRATARRCSATCRRTRSSRRRRRSVRSQRSRSSTAPTTPSTRANASSYGLSSGIITQDVERGLALAGQIDAGIVHVNDQPVGDEPQMPFGGVKDSGFGRFGGTAVVDEFTELRWVTVQRGSHPFPF